MSHDPLEITSLEDSTYSTRVASLNGETQLTLRLVDVDQVTDGRLADDEATARATFEFLLEHQDAADLPPQTEIEQVVAAYDNALDRIEELRG